MKTVTKDEIIRFIFLLAVSVFAVSCGKKSVKQADAQDPARVVSEAAVPDTGMEGSLGEGSLRNKEYAPDFSVPAVYFDFDKSELNDKARTTLRNNAAALKKRAGAGIQVAGHCDERGTTGYNLALGQRRANAVRDYYKYLGIKIEAMSTISYGEEKPICTDSAGECWARNRRAETLTAAK